MRYLCENVIKVNSPKYSKNVYGLKDEKETNENILDIDEEDYSTKKKRDKDIFNTNNNNTRSLTESNIIEKDNSINKGLHKRQKTHINFNTQYSSENKNNISSINSNTNTSIEEINSIDTCRNSVISNRENKEVKIFLKFFKNFFS